MKRILLLFLALLLVGVVTYWSVRKPEAPTGLPANTQIPGLLQDATRPAVADKAGPYWPDDSTMASMRQDWSALAPADSSLLDGLTMEWIHSKSKKLKHLVTAPEIGQGKDLSLEDRLRVGGLLVEHPEWKTGIMRDYPALAGVISPLEKRVLHLTALSSKTAPEIAHVLEIPVTKVRAAADAWVEVGWVQAHTGEPEETRYQATDKTVAQSGALAFITVRYRRGAPKHFVSLDAAIQEEREAMKTQWITFSGICPQTGKPLQVVLAAGRLRSGQPGSAYTAPAEMPGLSTGFFAGETAYREWSEKHPGAVGKGKAAVELFKEVLSEP